MIQVRTKKELRSLIDETIKEKGNSCDLNFIDTSLITDMSWLFSFNLDFNGDISKWDVSSVEYMCDMFQYSNFNGDISKWDTSKVTAMHGMFEGSEFNGDISKWNTSNVKYMRGMFSSSEFNGDISRWDVSNVRDMSNMFKNSKFNGNISNWNVDKIIYYSHFDKCSINNNYLPLRFRNLDQNKEYIGWKKLQDNKLCKLRIPSSAIKSRGDTGKCRCSEAIVLDIFDDVMQYKEGYSFFDSSFKYEVGKIVKPVEEFNLDRWNECSSGIHFFLTREDAIGYR